MVLGKRWKAIVAGWGERHRKTRSSVYYDVSSWKKIPRNGANKKREKGGK